MNGNEDHGEPAQKTVKVEQPVGAGFLAHDFGGKEQPPHDGEGRKSPGHKP